MREPIVKIFKDGNKNAGFAIATTARDADEFLRESSLELAVVLAEQKGDEDYALNGLLPQVCAIWAKLNGYKADGVTERRVLVAGEPNPEAHMQWLNAPAAEAEKQTA